MFDPYAILLGVAPGPRPPAPHDLLALDPASRDASAIQAAAQRQLVKLAAAATAVEAMALARHGIEQTTMSKYVQALTTEITSACDFLLAQTASAAKSSSFDQDAEHAWWHGESKPPAPAIVPPTDWWKYTAPEPALSPPPAQLSRPKLESVTVRESPELPAGPSWWAGQIEPAESALPSADRPAATSRQMSTPVSPVAPSNPQTRPAPAHSVEQKSSQSAFSARPTPVVPRSAAEPAAPFSRPAGPLLSLEEDEEEIIRPVRKLRSSGGNLLLWSVCGLLPLAIAGGGAVWYFKFRDAGPAVELATNDQKSSDKLPVRAQVETPVSEKSEQTAAQSQPPVKAEPTIETTDLNNEIEEGPKPNTVEAPPKPRPVEDPPKPKIVEMGPKPVDETPKPKMGNVRPTSNPVGIQPQKFRPNRGMVLSIAIGKKGDHFLSTGDDKAVVVTPLADGKRRVVHTLRAEGVAVSLCANDQRAVFCDGGSLVVYDMAKNQVIKSFDNPRGGIECLATTPDGRLALVGSTDGFVRIWNAAEGKLQREIDMDEKASVSAIDISADGALLTYGLSDGRVGTRDLKTGRELKRFKAHKGRVSVVSLAPDRKNFVSFGDDGIGRIWQGISGTVGPQLNSHKGAVVGAAWCADSNRLISLGTDGTVCLWNAQTGQRQEWTAKPEDKPYSIAIDPLDRFVLVGESGGFVQLFPLPPAASK